MSHNWSKVKEKHIEEACRLYDSGKEKPSREARNTFLILPNKEDYPYPAKFIRGLAYRLATGKSLNPNSDYEGGKETVNFFTERGYTVKYNDNGQLFNPLSDAFWKLYELDLQEVKIQYLKWALNSANSALEVSPEYIERFIWPGYTEFCIVNSQLGHAFAHSPFGSGVRGVPKAEIKGDDELTQEMKDLLKRLKEQHTQIREAIRGALDRGQIEEARNYVLDFFWLKLGPHELLFDRIHEKKETAEPENQSTCRGIRNRIVNVIRYGEKLEDKYVKNLDKMSPPDKKKNSKSTFLSHYMTWNRYAMCAFDCGPVLWSSPKTFVHFKDIKESMNRNGWPNKVGPKEILNEFYRIALDYKKKPIFIKEDPNDGYSLKSMRTREKELHSKLNEIIDQINQERSRVNKMYSTDSVA